jgi:hypothetical protein
VRVGLGLQSPTHVRRGWSAPRLAISRSGPVTSGTLRLQTLPGLSSVPALVAPRTGFPALALLCPELVPARMTRVMLIGMRFLSIATVTFTRAGALLTSCDSSAAWPPPVLLVGVAAVRAWGFWVSPAGSECVGMSRRVGFQL